MHKPYPTSQQNSSSAPETPPGAQPPKDPHIAAVDAIFSSQKDLDDILSGISSHATVKREQKSIHDDCDKVLESWDKADTSQEVCRPTESGKHIEKLSPLSLASGYIRAALAKLFHGSAKTTRGSSSMYTKLRGPEKLEDRLMF